MNEADVQAAARQAVGSDPCDGADLDRNGRCDAVDIQRLINAAMGQECRSAPNPPPPPPAGNGSSVLSYGAKCDGSTNDFAALQKAFDDAGKWINKTLTFPSDKTCVVASGVRLSGGGWTIEGRGATIKAANGMCLDGCGPLMMVYGVDRFAINNLNLDGNRANRKPAEKSGGHNLQILGSTDGSFRNFTSINATTDNARIAAAKASDPKTVSKNLTFTDSKFINAYRNNVSVIEGSNIKFLGTCTPLSFTGTCTCQMMNANGTGPEDGIDWEPNSGSAAPNIQDGLVDGCQLSGNGRHGYSDIAVNHGAHNITLQNSIIRDNGWGIGVRSYGALIQNNYFTQPTKQLRFAWVYLTSVTSDATPLNPARPTRIINNFFDGQPPIGYDSGKRQLVWFGNCTPSSTGCSGTDKPSMGDGSSQFKNNTITNSGFTAGGDWCSSGPSGGSGTSVSGNTFDGVLQSPNPGCP